MMHMVPQHNSSSTK